MDIYQILCLIGTPALTAGVFKFCMNSIMKKIRESDEHKREQEIADQQHARAVELGLQAVLRRMLRQEYARCMAKEFATIAEKEDFEFMWAQYHSLGVNGVMDGVHVDFMDLPTEPPKGDNNNEN